MRVFRALCNAIFQEIRVKAARELIPLRDDSKSKNNEGNGKDERLIKG